tara:strand:- start:944 stop:2062 length:1119 start_codon:yes stop_codon:yes gene_type:complete
MARVNTYILKQLLALFGFFALVLVLIYWINRAVRLFDRLIADGQSAMVFLEFTSLTLPWIISVIAPIAGFAAVVYVVNRLAADSELVILKIAGLSAGAIAKPVWMFAISLAGLIMVLSNILVPISQAKLHQRQLEVAENLTARLLTEGTFLNPSDEVTFYLRQITAEGELKGVFLNDTSDRGKNLTYSAAKAFLVRSDDGPRLVLIDGLLQSLDLYTDQLTVTKFNDFVINIGQIVSPRSEAQKKIYHFTSFEIWDHIIRGTAPNGTTAFEAVFALNQRIAGPLMSIFAVLIGYAVMVTAEFSRFGLWRPVLTAIFYLIILKFLEGLCLDYVRRAEGAVLVMYMPLLFGFLSAYGIILSSDRPWAKSQAAIQ